MNIAISPHAEINAFYDAFCDLCADKAAIARLSALKTSGEICDFLRENHGGLFGGVSSPFSR
ncbi:MAG: hypothetical protein LBO72_00180 [Helicobacteraceae bacterium]|nr:hypothetical protein [Helicobacteraceae bacterium]